MFFFCLKRADTFKAPRISAYNMESGDIRNISEEGKKKRGR